MNAQTATKLTIDEQAATLGLRRVKRLPFEWVYQGYDLPTVHAAYIRRMGVAPDVFVELGGYVYVWKAKDGE